MARIRRGRKGLKERGRPRHVPPLRKTMVNMTEDQAAMLRKWGRGCLSEGLRWLLDQVVATDAVGRPDLPRSSA